MPGISPAPRRPAAGGTITSITIDRFEDGKIVEAWRSMDTLGLLRGIGALCGD
jgi:predicted ester cyclase